MTQPLRIFIGYDERESAAYHVLAHSILTRSSIPVSLSPLVQPTLRQSRLYWREPNPMESTAFSFTRFLVPALCDYKGVAVFCDSDMLFRVDVAELYGWIASDNDKAVLVCKHDYEPKDSGKFFGNVQTKYAKKNWSSFMVFSNDQCKALTPEYVNTATGLDLHRFNWLREDQVGSLPLTYNWLVGEYEANPKAKVLHWTLGGPYLTGYESVDHAEEWFAERDAMLGAQVTV